MTEVELQDRVETLADSPAEYFDLDNWSSHQMPRAESEPQCFEAANARFQDLKDQIAPLKRRRTHKRSAKSKVLMISQNCSSCTLSIYPIRQNGWKNLKPQS